jgi:hypothetical protein
MRLPSGSVTPARTLQKKALFVLNFYFCNVVDFCYNANVGYTYPLPPLLNIGLGVELAQCVCGAQVIS